MSVFLKSKNVTTKSRTAALGAIVSSQQELCRALASKLNSWRQKMKWLSIDPAGTSGYAVWQGDQLLTTGIVKKKGAHGKHYLTLNAATYACRYDAWVRLLNDSEATLIVIEEGCGSFTTAVKSQAELRGYIHAIADAVLPCYSYFEVVNVSEWRRVIKEGYGISWPKDRDRCKALSVQLVKDHFGIEVTNDESDAILIGAAALRMGLAKKGA
jgi:hypothetical protein